MNKNCKHADDDWLNWNFCNRFSNIGCS